MQQVVVPLDQDIWTTSVFSYAPGGGGPGGGLADDVLKVGGWGDVYYSLLKFDLTGLPKSATHVELRLYDLNAASGTPIGLNLYQITQDWNWQTQGTGKDHERLWWADQPSAVIDTVDPSTLPAPTIGAYYDIDITYLYNAWQSGALPNYGLELRPTGISNNFDIFASSRNADTDFRPALVITSTETPVQVDLPFGPNVTYAHGTKGTYITQDFGQGYVDPKLDHGSTHTSIDEDLYYSIDFALDLNTPVLAQGTGEIISIVDDIPDGDTALASDGSTHADHGFGNYVTIRYDFANGQHLYATYMHLEQFRFPYVHPYVGEKVLEGDVIGFVGMSGATSGPHLHVTYGVQELPENLGRLNPTYVDTADYDNIFIADGRYADNPQDGSQTHPANGPVFFNNTAASAGHPAFLSSPALANGHLVHGQTLVRSSVIDAYLAGTTVFADQNGNGQLDPGENSTVTDGSGDFTPSFSTGPLVAFGGSDTSTGLQFKGQLSAPEGSLVITPLTTLLTELGSDPLAEQKVLAAFGLSTSLDLTTFDPIAAAQVGNPDGAATEIAAAKVYDTVSLIASALVGAGGNFSTGLRDAFAAVAAAIDGPGISLTYQADVSALIKTVAQSEGLILGQGVVDSVAAIIVASNVLLDEKAENGATGDALLNDLAAIERVIQGTVSNAIQQASNDSGQLQALVAAFTGANLDHAVETTLSHLGSDDETAPTLTPVTDQTLEATTAAGAAAFFAATATDLVDGTDPVVFKEGNTVVHSGDIFGLGNHTITVSTIDAAGNSASETFKINVVDTTGPTLTPVADQTKEATSAAGSAAFFAATATDLVDGTDPVVFKEGNTVVHSGDIFSLGSHTITATTIDAAGNLALESFTTNVKDTTAPTLTPVADQTLQATTNAGAAATFTATATDLVDGTDPVVFKEGNTVVHSGDIFGVGTHTITASTVDVAGNASSETFKINVVGPTSHNRNPIALPDSNGVAKGKTISVSASKGVLANDSDSDHDHLSVGTVNGSAANVGHSVQGAFGTLILNADGSYSYAATTKALPSQILAQDSFTYTTADGHGGTATSTLTFAVFDPSASYQAGSNTILWGGNSKNVLDGSGGHDLLYGSNGADVLIGGKGDILAGGRGPDQFVFRPDFGVNTILDFDVNNDHLQFDNSVFDSVKSIIDHTSNTPLGALISDGHGDSVLLLGVNKSQLVAHSSDLLIA